MSNSSTMAQNLNNNNLGSLNILGGIAEEDNDFIIENERQENDND